MSISKHLIEPDLKTLWWWQRGKVLHLVTECLEYIKSGNLAKVYELVDSLNGKPKQVLILCLRDCLRYVQYTGEQILEALDQSV